MKMLTSMIKVHLCPLGTMTNILISYQFCGGHFIFITVLNFNSNGGVLFNVIGQWRSHGLACVCEGGVKALRVGFGSRLDL